MPVARIYTKADAKSAIDTANNHYFGSGFETTSLTSSSTAPTPWAPGNSTTRAGVPT